MDTASSRRERHPQCRSQSRDSNRAQAPIRLWSPTSECDWLCLLGEIRGIHFSSFQTGNNTDISSLRRLPAPAEVTRGHAVVSTSICTPRACRARHRSLAASDQHDSPGKESELTDILTKEARRLLSGSRSLEEDEGAADLTPPKETKSGAAS